MHTLVIAVALAVLAQNAAAPEPNVLNAKLGGNCSADFVVKDLAGAPVYSASIQVRVRYGALGVKRADLEIGTDGDGKARIEGLPTKAKPMVYTVAKGDRRTTVEQNVEKTCAASFAVQLK